MTADLGLDLVQMSSDILAHIDENGVLVFINAAVQTHLGFDPQHMHGRDIVDWVHPEEQILFLARLRQADPDSPRDDQPFKIRLRAGSGHWVYFEVRLQIPDQAPGVLMQARTIVAEERYRELFEESRDAIVIGTLDGRIVDINPAGVRLFGFDDKEQMLQLDIARDLYWNPQDRERTGAMFRSQGYMQDTEIELRTRDGQKIRVVESASAVRDPRGNLVGFRGFLRDVTEHRRLEGRLRQSQKMEAVGRLAGGVAHDFNNLLTTVNGYSELVLARLDHDDPQRNAVEEIRKAGKRATDLTRRLLTLSRHQVVSPRRMHLNRSVLDMEKLLQRVLGEDILLRTRLDAGLPPVFADQSQIEQVILNLAVNARDAMPEGGELELQTRSIYIPEDQSSSAADLDLQPGAEGVSGDMVLLKVRDTGRGMEKSVREKAFEPFFTTKEQGHNTGLGLAIVYGIIAQANGFIEIDSATDQGTTFRIYLPADLPQEALPDDRELIPGGDESILVVEDETSVRVLVQQVLKLHGYRVTAVADSASALDTCRDPDQQRPDLLLTDVVMPGGSGLGLAAKLQVQNESLKVLFMSGYTDRHGDIRLLQQRREAFLPKPFSPETLARTVREILDS